MNQETGTAVHTEPPAAPAARWAIVEIMGHRIVVHVREITRAMLPAPAKATPVRPQEREGLYVEIDERLTDQEYDEVAYPAEVIAAIESHDRVDAEFDLDGYTPDDDDDDDDGDLLSDPESGGPDDEPHGGGCP